MKLKNIALNSLFIIISSVLNIGIFFVAYKKLTFPFLHESQRMDNAPLIFSYVVPSFILVSICMLLLVHLVNIGKGDRSEWHLLKPAPLNKGLQQSGYT